MNNLPHWSNKFFTWIFLFFLLPLASCAAPSMMGFPHATLHPHKGNEIAVAGFGGVGIEHRFAGGLASYARNFNKVGLSISGGGYTLNDTIAYGGHTELGIPLDPKKQTSFLVGAGYSGLHKYSHSPQLSVGLLSAASKEGAFGGARLNGGPLFIASEVGIGLSVSAGVGYRIRPSDSISINIQAAPYINCGIWNLSAGDGGGMCFVGGLAIVGMGFDL